MWTTTDDARRYDELTRALAAVVERDAPARGEEHVDLKDLALYLEWLELAREVATSLRPFIDKSSPYPLPALSYRQLAHDFRQLRDRTQPQVWTV
jgi:hypothetical protein